MVRFPVGEKQWICAVCEEPMWEYSTEFSEGYANLVCRKCDEKAVAEDGSEAEVGPHDGQGDNPVFIDGVKCWRRIRFGGFVTRRDEHDCDSVREFHEKHRPDYDDPDEEQEEERRGERRRGE